jgi:ubiquinone/menaquinone biosynthesis C-methylase UbiE
MGIKSRKTWKEWQSKLHFFEVWLKERHAKTEIRFWSYMSDMFSEEISTLSNSGGLCLDVGCGSGEYLYRFVEVGRYYGIGIDPLKEPSLKIFKDRIKGLQISEKIELINGVGEYLPIKEDSVQLCIMTSTLDHVSNPDQTLRESHRVLASDGHLILLQSVVWKKTPNFKEKTHMQEFTMADLKDLLAQFRIEKVKRLFIVPPQIPIPDKLLAYNKTYKALSRIFGIIIRWFKPYVTIIKSKKTKE